MHRKLKMLGTHPVQDNLAVLAALSAGVRGLYPQVALHKSEPTVKQSISAAAKAAQPTETAQKP